MEDKSYVELLNFLNGKHNDILAIMNCLGHKYNEEIIVKSPLKDKLFEAAKRFDKKEVYKILDEIRGEEIHSMTLTQLREKAKEYKIHNYSRKNTFELICEIERAERIIKSFERYKK